MHRGQWVAVGWAVAIGLCVLGLSAAPTVANGARVGPSPADAPTPAAAGALHSAPILVHGAPPPTVISHWYAGSYLAPSVANISAREVSVQLTVPSANISSETNQFYYVLLSVWDNAGSYDQIGIANSFGTWGFTYSFTSYCAASYYYNPDYFNLVPGTTYTFAMTMVDDGFVDWSVYEGATYVGGLSVITGATAFNVSSFYSCDGATYYDFTDYEEVYYTQQVTPDFDFHFAATHVNGADVKLASFTTPGAPARVHVKVGAGATTLANVGFELLYTGTSGVLVSLPVGTASYIFTIRTEEIDGASHLTGCSRTSPGWNIRSWPGTPSPPFDRSVTLTINASAPAGDYLEYLYAYNAGTAGPGCTGPYTFVTLEVILV